MPLTPCRIVVNPQETVSVTVYTAGGAVTPAYTTENGAAAWTFPTTVNAGTVTTFWLPNPGTYSISALFRGVEIAGPAGDRLPVGLDPGMAASVAIGVNRPAEEDVVSGASLPLTGGTGSRITGNIYTANGVAFFARANDDSTDFIVLQTTSGDQVILGPSTGDRDCVVRSAGIGDIGLEPGGVVVTSKPMVIGSLNGGLLGGSDGLHVVGKISSDSVISATSWEAWVDATSLLVNSWANFGAPFANIHYRKSGDGTTLKLTGVIGGGANGSTAFTLPAGYRPATRHDIGVQDGASGGLINVNINTNGTVALSGTGRTQVSMDLVCPLDI